MLQPIMKKVITCLLIFSFCTLLLADEICDKDREELAHYASLASSSKDAEEIYLAHFHLARLQERLELSQKDIELNYELAFAACPNRREPLFYLGAYLRNRDLFDKSARVLGASLSIPKPEAAPELEPWIYDYGALFEYSISCYWVARYKDTINICDELLQRAEIPQNIREACQRNRNFAIKMLATQGI